MKKNMGITDRVIRVVIAATISALFFSNLITGTLAIILLTFAGVFLLTSLISFCPLYSLLSISSRNHKAQAQ